MSSKHFCKQNAKLTISHIFLIITFKIVFFIYTCDAIKIRCSHTDEFYFTSPGSQCGTYYKCTKGQKENQECSRGSKFDFYQQSCSHSPGNCNDPSCIGRANGIYQDITHACMRSFTCYAGQLISLDNCPPKHLHNGQKCVQNDLVNCHTNQSNSNEYVDNIVTDFNSERSSTINTLDDKICSDKKDGPTEDPTSKDCSTYIVCKDGRNEGQQRCSAMANFNGQECVPNILHQCTLTKRHTDAQDQCHKKPNGYYANPQHGCESYIRCVSERTVEVGVCPASQYFDMETRKCVYERVLDRRRCLERGISSDCDSRIDGFYTTSKCDTYFYCRNNYKIEYKCLTGKVFNGKECVAKTEYKCSKSDDENFCYSRPDGYYKDANDGCRAYVYCSNDHKITYVCETGHIFDSKSKKCVRKELLGKNSNHCHSDHVCYGKSDGYHADLQSNCRNYVYCKNDEKITQLTCRDGKVFNGLQCVLPTQYACPSLFNHRQINCVQRNCLKRCELDGFYADLSSDCRDYHFCISGKSSKLSCPSGKRFNGELCVAEDKYSCPVFCS